MVEPVAIFDADAPPALAFVRSLGRTGVPVHVFSHRGFPVARFSRHIAKFERCPDTADAARFLPWLEEKLLTNEIRLVAPTSDVLAYYLAEVNAKGMPSKGALLDALLKDRFAAACDRLGVRTPWSLSPRSYEEACDIADQVRYPAILKPRSHVGVGIARGLVVHDKNELVANYRAYDIPAEQTGIVARHPELAWPIIQEYVPRALENLFSVSGVIADDGSVVAAAASRKISQWPPALGVGTLFEPCHDPALIDRGAAIAAGILGRGIFELELIRDTRDGEYVAIDLNPRGYGQMRFEMARGFDLPRLWYACATGECGEEARALPQAHDLLMTHALPFHIGRVISLLRSPSRLDDLKHYLQLLRRPRVDIVNDMSDPLPSVAFAARMLRHPGGLVRPFWMRDARA